MNVKCDLLVSKFAFEFNLYRYIEEYKLRVETLRVQKDHAVRLR